MESVQHAFRSSNVSDLRQVEGLIHDSDGHITYPGSAEERLIFMGPDWKAASSWNTTRGGPVTSDIHGLTAKGRIWLT